MEYHNFTYKHFSFINSDNKGIGYYRLIYIIFVQSILLEWSMANFHKLVVSFLVSYFLFFNLFFIRIYN